MELFEEIFNESLDLLQEGLEFLNGKNVVKDLYDGKLNRAIGAETLPEFYEHIDKYELAEIFDSVISEIKSFSSEDSKLSPVQPILLILKKAKSIKDLKEMASMKDTLIEFARTSKTDFKKSKIYKKITMEPFSVELWHSFEKAAQGYVDTSTHEATASSHTYETLFDSGEWKLFVPHSFEDDSHLAGGLEEFRCINADDEVSVTTKAQWCTAAREDFYKNYSIDENNFYIAKHYLPNGKSDEAFQVAFSSEQHVEIKDKFDMDLWNNTKDRINETHLAYLFDKAPKELLAKIVNDNPKCEIKNSLLDYVEMSHLLGNGYENIDDIIFSDKKDIEEYVATGVYVYTSERGRIPSYVKSLTITNNVTSIGDYAFYNCNNLTSIEIPESVTSIGYNAFNGCSSLTSIVIPDSVTSIGDKAFYSCTSLTSINIPDSVTSIGESAFRDCTSLTSINTPDSVTSIGEYAFYGCKSLTSINIPDSVTSIGKSAFHNCRGLTSIEIPDSVTSIDNEAFYGCSNLTSIVIPDSVTSISNGAFSNCGSLTSIEIPDSVNSISSFAFYRCTSLTSIVIPNGVNSIGSFAFDGCTSLTSINIPNSVTNIGGSAFSGCNQDLIIYTNSEYVKEELNKDFKVLPLNHANLNESIFQEIFYTNLLNY